MSRRRKRVRLHVKTRIRLNSKKRVKLNKKTVDVWGPQWSVELSGWARTFIQENRWRLEYIHDLDDAMQEAYLVYERVRSAYPLVIQPQHFMALYKTSLKNYFHDRARELRRKRELIVEGACVELTPVKSIQDASIASDFEMLLLEHSSACPEELKMFFQFIREDKNLELWREPQRGGRGEPRLSFDQRISRLLGIEDFPFRKALSELFN